MSSCFAFNDNARTDMYTSCNQSVDMMKNVKTPLVEYVLEMTPASRIYFSKNSSFGGSGLLHKKRSGGIGSWVQTELKIGFPTFQMRVEEPTIYVVGKDQTEPNMKVKICGGRCVEAHVDQDFSLLTGNNAEESCNQFYQIVKENHCYDHLQYAQLAKYYEPSDAIFQPTRMAKVEWMMTHSYSDLWEIIYHGKTPELIWELNMAAGGAFEDLVSEDSDPQAVVINLPKKMSVGEKYGAACFVDERKKKAVYVLAPAHKFEVTEAVLVVCALYNWDGVPEDGKTTTKSDIDITASAAARGTLIDYCASNGLAYKESKFVDFSKMSK